MDVISGPVATSEIQWKVPQNMRTAASTKVLFYDVTRRHKASTAKTQSRKQTKRDRVHVNNWSFTELAWEKKSKFKRPLQHQVAWPGSRLDAVQPQVVS